MIDLDEVERGAGTFFPEDLAELTWQMVAELRAAREVVEAVRFRLENGYTGQSGPTLRGTLTAYDRAVAS